MQVQAFHGDPLSLDVPLIAVAVGSGEDPLGEEASALDSALGGAFAAARAAGDFRGREEDQALFYLPGASLRRILFLGAGSATNADPERVRAIAARAVRRAESLSLRSVALILPSGLGVEAPLGAQAAAEGAVLAAWDYRELRSEPEAGDDSGDEAPAPPLVDDFVLCAGEGEEEPVGEGVRVGVAFGEGENLARTLQSRPGNVASPEHLAAVAEELAGSWGFELTVLGPREMREEGMGALLAVAAGSDREPRLIALEHRGGPADRPPLALVGKGLTFDAGGISIKPAAGMEDMKFDMSGGAAVLGAMKAIGMLGLPVNVVGVVPSSENLLSGSATRPGDIIRTRAGRTVEVINTDAEGRLILADALSWVVDRYQPEAILDCATLTGAVVVALGNQAAAVLGNDDALVEEVRAAGERAGERCWPLPLWKGYRKQLESTVADLRNVGGRQAGTITAAWFLREFVGEVRWAHLDIAGTAYGDPRAPYQRKGGFGFPTRLLLEWVRASGA